MNERTDLENRSHLMGAINGLVKTGDVDGRMPIRQFCGRDPAGIISSVHRLNSTGIISLLLHRFDMNKISNKLFIS